MVGDSLSLGTGAPTPGYRDLGWSDRVARLLQGAHPETEYLNLAELGATTDRIIADQAARMAEFDPDLMAGRVQRINDLTRTIAAEHDAVVVDMWDHPLNDRANLVSPDGIHFSTSGQAVMAIEVVRALCAHPT